jgi:LacI family transcriptional regulator
MYGMKKKVVIKDVAALAGVSVGSVSNYLNNIGNLKAATKKKIEAAIDKLEYEPDFLARSMRTGKTNSIAVIVPDITNPFFAEIYNSIKVSAIKKGLFPIL